MNIIGTNKKMRVVRFLVLLIGGIIFVSEAPAQKQFYQAISGTYLDGKTGEIVSIGWNDRFSGLTMYYQANETQATSKAKKMEQLAVNENKLWMKVKFKNSNYLCEFTFKPDFESFICKNPDGTQQVFKRNPFPSRKSFAYFLAQFPKQNQSYFDITKMPKTNRSIPVEFTMKFLVSQHQAFYNEVIFPTDSLKSDQQKIDLMRTILIHKAMGEHWPRTIAFYSLYQIHLSDHFHTILFRVEGHPHYEAKFDEVYMANFNSSGKLLGIVAITYALFNYVYSDTEAVGTINQNKIKLVETTAYNRQAVVPDNPKLVRNKTIAKAYSTYNLASDGQISMTDRFFAGVSGQFYTRKNEVYVSCMLHREKSGFLIEMAEYIGEKEVHNKLNFLSYESSKQLLKMKNQKGGKVWEFQFNPNKTTVKIIKPDGTEINLKR